MLPYKKSINAIAAAESTPFLQLPLLMSRQRQNIVVDVPMHVLVGDHLVLF